MNSVPDDQPEMVAQLAQHPAAQEAAADLHSLATGLRPQHSEFAPIPSRPVRVPCHNARVRGFLAYRQAQFEARGERLIVAEPHRLAFRSLIGARRVPNGYALNLEYAYYSPSGRVYVLTGFALGNDDGPLTGEAYARECSCPDFQKRRGEARDQIRGEARCCKHMRLFLAVVHLWQGQLPWIGGVPKAHLLPGEAWVLRVF